MVFCERVSNMTIISTATQASSRSMAMGFSSMDATFSPRGRPETFGKISVRRLYSPENSSGLL